MTKKKKIFHLIKFLTLSTKLSTLTFSIFLCACWYVRNRRSPALGGVLGPRHHLLLCYENRMGYMICRGQCQMKTWGSVLKNYYRFQEGDEGDHRALNWARGPLELGALCNLCAACPGSRRDAVQEGEACISASPFLAPSQLGLSQRSALNSPSSVNCSPPSTFAPHLRLSVSSVYIVVPRKSHRYWVLKGLTQGVKGDAPRGFPIKAALLPLSRTLTSSPTMGFSLSLWVWQNPL